MSTRKIHHWIFESPLAIRSLKWTADRDTVKGRRWRPVFGKNRAEFLYINFHTCIWSLTRKQFPFANGFNLTFFKFTLPIFHKSTKPKRTLSNTFLAR